MLRRDTIKTIIFLCTFLESYIYDFAGIMLGDNYVKTHLDKLDLISKWIIIPKIITGKEIDKKNSYFSRLKELVKWRNKLIHPKSKDGVSFINNIKDNENINIESYQLIYDQVDIKSFFIMTKDLLNELDRIDKNGYHYLRIENGLNRIQ